MLRMVNDRADGSLTARERDDRAWIINAARRARHQPPRIRCLCPGPTETDPVIEPPNAPLIDAVAAALAASSRRSTVKPAISQAMEWVRSGSDCQRLSGRGMK